MALGTKCDPAPDHDDRYVGPGDPLRNLPAHVPDFLNPGNWGWLDTDQDGVINGNDLCPFTAGLELRPCWFRNCQRPTSAASPDGCRKTRR